MIFEHEGKSLCKIKVLEGQWQGEKSIYIFMLTAVGQSPSEKVVPTRIPTNSLRVLIRFLTI